MAARIWRAAHGASQLAQGLLCAERPAASHLACMGAASSRWLSTSRPAGQDQQSSGAGGASTSTSGSSSSPSDLRARLLEAALPHVKTHGWSDAALVAAAHDLQLSPSVTGILPRREGELVEHLIEGFNRRLVEQLAQREPELMATEDVQRRLAVALRLRLEMIEPHMDSWPQALGVATRGSNLPHSLKLLGRMVDDIWHAVGDRTSDSSWYTKRALLAAVYTSIELYMLTDYSPGFQETWSALDRRLQDMLSSNVAQSVEGLTGQVADIAAAALRRQQQAAAAAGFSEGAGRAHEGSGRTPP